MDYWYIYISSAVFDGGGAAALRASHFVSYIYIRAFIILLNEIELNSLIV